MQYDKNLFGEGIKVYSKGGLSSNTPLYDFTIPSQNANLSAAFKSGALTNNAPLPDNLFYWMIGKDSPYNHFSCLFRSGSSPNYTYTKRDTEKNNKNIPVVLWSGMTKINADYDIDVYNGTNTTTSANNAFLAFNQSNFRVTGTSNNTPLWEKCADISPYLNANGAYSSYPFILDFDYNSFIYTIKVGYGSTFVDLANYNNTSSNYISIIGAQLNTGDVSTGYNRENIQARVDVNGQQIVYPSNAPAIACYRVVSDFDYNAPTWIRDLGFYGYEKFRKIAITQNNTNYILFNGTNVSTNENNSTPSYYMDGDKWEFDNGVYKLKKHGNGIYNEDDYNYIRKLIAWFGFWFTDGGVYTDSEHSYTINRANALLGDNANTYAESYMIPDRVYQAEIKNGVTTGNFTELRIAKDNEQSKWGTEWRTKNGYNGRDGSGENKDRGNLKTTIRNSMIPTNTRDYAMTGTQLKQLITWCNSGFQVTDSNQFLEDFKGLNPADCVISAMYFPFDVGAMATAAVHVGNLDTGITAQYANMGANFGGGSEFSYSPLTINREFGDFRDYAPYTTIDMYIPFCGSVSLDPADVYGYDLTVTIIPDLMTGSCTGCIYRGEYLLQTIDGKIGMPITLSLGQVGDYQNAVTQAQFNLKNANRQMFNSWLGAVASVGAIATGAGAVVGIAGLTGSAMGMLQAQDNIKKAEYDLAHIARNFNTVGSVSDVNTVMVLPEYVHMIIKRPYNLQGADISQYAHTVGHACNRQGYASDFSGYTLASDIDLTGISATAEELEQIRKYFATGVYL